MSLSAHPERGQEQVGRLIQPPVLAANLNSNLRMRQRRLTEFSTDIEGTRRRRQCRQGDHTQTGTCRSPVRLHTTARNAPWRSAGERLLA